MATKKSKGKAKSDLNPQVQRILESAENTRPNVAAFVQWIEDQGGPELDPEHTQIVISSYKHFQKSDAALAYREEVGTAREQAEAQREKEREEKAAARKAAAAEEKAKKDAAAAKSSKTTKGKATAAKQSVPAKKTAAKPAAKKAAPAKAKKSTKAKAAF